MSHTPWSRDEYGHVVDCHGKQVTMRDLRIALAGAHVGEAEKQTNEMIATINFFHSDDGRAIPTDKLAEMQGGFWEMVKMLERTERYVPPGQFRDEVRALLDRMGVR